MVGVCRIRGYGHHQLMTPGARWSQTMNVTISKPQEAVLSHGVESLPAKTGLGRTFLFGEIRLGRLKAVKAGRRTLVRDDDLRAYLGALPVRKVA